MTLAGSRRPGQAGVKAAGPKADEQGMRSLFVLIGLASTVTAVWATPDSATWHRQSLLGENADYFFRYVTISEYPASYYSHRRTLRLEKVRKSDLGIIEQIPLLDMSYAEDPMTGALTERSATLPTFNLSGYLARNAVHLPFADDLGRTFAIDSSGISEVFEDGRVIIAGSADLARQIPHLGEEPRVAGIEKTDYEPATGAKGFFYLRVWSNSASGDDDWSEDLVLVNRLAVQ